MVDRQPTPDNRFVTRSTAKVVGAYAAFAGLWILLSDQLLGMLVTDRHQLTRISMYKGWFFVAVTSLLLALLIRRYLQVLHSSQQRWTFALEGAGDGVFDWDIRTGEVFFSLPLARMLGYRSVAEFGTDKAAWEKHLHPEEAERVLAALNGYLNGTLPAYVNEYRMRCTNGDWRWILARGMVVERDPAGRPLRMVGTHTDTTSRKQAEARIEFLAYHDALTSLPNLQLLKDRFEQAAAFAERNETLTALVVVDLDNFKTINDSLGHRIGNEVIKRVAERFGNQLREMDTLARPGGDEFFIMLGSLSDAEEAAATVNRLLDTLHQSLGIEGQELGVSASIGLAIFPTDGKDFESLQKKAEIAMYRAKEAGRNTYRFFDEAMNAEALEQLRLRNGLQQALTRQELVLHYQPQFSLADGRLIGVEALVRWQHPEQGLVPPGVFIPVAEESGMIVPIGAWVLQEACRQGAHWQQAEKHGGPEVTVAVNLSAVQFRRGNLEQTVAEALAASGLNPQRLELELTESILIAGTDTTLATLHRLKALGVKLSIDDFGTGYSSLSYLKRFPLDKVKIDQSFVRNLSDDAENRAIVRAIVQMADSFQLKTIAEGVEDEATLEQLRGLGCTEAQGYYFARPLPPAELARHFPPLSPGMS